MWVCDGCGAIVLKELFDGEIELDESYFGGVRKGKRGCGAGGKTAVFGLLKRNGKVFVVVVKDTKTNTLMPIIASKIKPDSVVYTDSYKSYNVLDVSDFKHFRINHSKEFAKDHNHINSIEIFGRKPRECLENTMALTRKTFIFL
ncbi:Transposase and inactivated derivatives [Moraxella caprae]|uniref:Transposase and inactivated derivatives n=2 Tax=Moraxella caprae TaxID=90240 RepID=A0A378R358_9GAMM|nr:Transposase and inactivated derivatives [Moraxella caprae]